MEMRIFLRRCVGILAILGLIMILSFSLFRGSSPGRRVKRILEHTSLNVSSNDAPRTIQTIKIDLYTSNSVTSGIGTLNNFALKKKDEVQRVVPKPPYVVPNIVHFIWFTPDKRKELGFLNYISILSAHLIQKPERISLHCNHVPSGKWWRRLLRRVTVKIVNKNIPRHIFGQALGNVFHSGDVAKLEIMNTDGGIYLDLDVIVVNNLDPLRLHNATMGKEKSSKFIAGIMVGQPGAEFFRLVYESYRNDYRPEDWDYNCARRPYEIYIRNPQLLHVEPYKLTTPDFQDRHLLFKEIINWRDLYVVHVMGHLMPPNFIQPHNIKKLPSTLGEVIRYIYYGSPVIRH